MITKKDFGVYRIVCISNRVSLPDPKTGDIKAGGLAVGVKAALEANGGGLWFGWDGSVCKPHERRGKVTSLFKDGITFLTMPLTEKEYEGYYKNMANENLWPLMHQLDTHIDGNCASFNIYKQVNKLFARAIKPYLRPGDLVWVHDYHLIPLGRELRALDVDNPIGFFNHIPVPAREFLDKSSVPVYLSRQFRQLLQTLFYYDLVGFQSFRDYKNFQSCLGYSFYAIPERYRTTESLRGAKRTRFGVFPISIETADLIQKARQNENRRAAFKHEKERYRLLIGAERLDYTKGLSDRLNAFFEFLTHYPEYQKKIQYHQITPLSRDDIRQYKQTIEKTRRAAEKIQNTFGDESWQPLAYTEEFMPREQLVNNFRHSDVGLVTPLIDGQNLVAKEYLAVQDPRDPGILILSKNAGATEELKDLGVLCVDPANTADIAEKIDAALKTPRLQRIEQHRKALSYLYQFDIEHWARSFLDQLVKSKPQISKQKDITIPASAFYSSANF